MKADLHKFLHQGPWRQYRSNRIPNNFNLYILLAPGIMVAPVYSHLYVSRMEVKKISGEFNVEDLYDLVNHFWTFPTEINGVEGLLIHLFHPLQ